MGGWEGEREEGREGGRYPWNSCQEILSVSGGWCLHVLCDACKLMSSVSPSIPPSTDFSVLPPPTLHSIDVRCERGRFHTTSHLETLIRL